MTRLLLALTFLLSTAILPAQDSPSVGLEARLKESAEASPQAATLMLELIALYTKEEQVFGLIRTAAKFSRAQPSHPKRPEVMITLLKGYAIASRHDDVIATGRQFVEKYPEHPLAVIAQDHLATSFERTGQLIPAADAQAASWTQSGQRKAGIRALQLYSKAGNAEAHRKATALALAMTGKLPVDAILTAVGIRGLEMASHAEQWADGLQIAKTLQRRKAPMDADQRRKLHEQIGHFQSSLGQHENAIASYRKALSPKRDDLHRTLINSLADAKRPPAEIEKEARIYFRAFPTRPDRYDQLALAAHAFSQAENSTQARRLAEEVMVHDVSSHDIVRSYITWCGEDHRQAEKGLLQAITKNPKGAGTLRGALAILVYRDQMKNPAKSRAMSLEFLAKSPSEDGWVEEVIAHLLNSAPDAATFKKDLAALVKSAQTFPEREGFQSRLWNRGPKEKAYGRAWQQARKGHQNDQVAKLWRATRENGGKSGQACQALLKRNPNAVQKFYLTKRLPYVYRHHLGGGARKTSAKHYQTLCQAYPKDFDSAERWLEAAAYAEKKKETQTLAAAQHLLSLSPQAVHQDTWLSLIGTRKPELIRKALPWITKSSALSLVPAGHSARLGDIMMEIEMKEEAVKWWRSRMDLDPQQHDYVHCALRVAATMDPPKARQFLAPRMKTSSNFQGAYAAAIADYAFKSDDISAMEGVLQTSHERARKQPFRDWTIGEWPARNWLDAARNNKEWPADKKAKIYRLVRDLEHGRVSAEAGLELMATEKRGVPRLLETGRVLLFADQHYESWKRLYPYAQAAVAREDYTLGATILNGLLHSIRSVGEAQMKSARTMLRRAYGKMGSMGSDIPPDSPLAPLLEIILHLRLGENELAEGTYYQHRNLFDAHRDDLPVELILFGAQVHIDQGTPEDHDRAEDILRGWLIKFSESDKVEVHDKAQVQLLLARKYQRSLQFDIARAEFTSVLNHYKDQPEAVEAQFGIGETFMAQKVYDQAEEIFVALAEKLDPRIRIRAEFLRGVLSVRQGNNEEARKIFLEVLEHAPEAELANATLYNLAEVYGVEQRYLTQLETLRTVGRLGRESKLWHTPGNALSVVVQDSDLGISRGNSRIPVIIRTDPGQDEEKSFLASGGAGKGIFLTEVPTTLGEAQANDGTLQITGGDTITVDYPADFKKQFQFEFLSNTRLRVASDGALRVASSEIINEDEETFTAALKKEVDEKPEALTKSAARPQNQVKPGNFVYIQVKDGDRDLTGAPDKVPVKLTASSGDEVQTEITEESQHGGVFSGTVRTGELPAGAQASDSALDHNALMAIDHSKESAWRSEPDGAAPKSLSLDLKELRPVSAMTLTSPEAENEAPVRMRVRGSHDGRFWYTLADFPTPETALSIPLTQPEMQLRVYPLPAKSLRDKYSWKEVVGLVEKEKPRDTLKSESLSWTPPEKGEEAFFLVWTGKFLQERDGGMRLSVSGLHTALMIDGRLELPPAKGDQSADIYAKRGIHELTVFAIAKSGGATAEVLRARENPQSSKVSLLSFGAADFDLTNTEDYPAIERPVGGEIAQDDNNWTLSLPEHTLRFLECEFLEYRGEAIAISNVAISGGGKTHVPPAQDVMELAVNNILELAPGDTVQISYLDELTAGAQQRNRLLTAQLTATYSNGKITPITYDFGRSSPGSIQKVRKELLRIDPGDRIVAEVIDYDLDVGLSADEVEIEIQVNADPPRTLTAIESGPSTGVFLIEIDTSAQAEEGKLTVKQGDKVFLRYKDTQNTFPGHAFDRETVVYLNEPTDGRIQIVESGKEIDGALKMIPVADEHGPDFVSKVSYHLPLTIEVIDPDQAKDSGSKVLVEVETTQGTTVQVECVLSRAFASKETSVEDVRNPALLEGRFVGQVPLLLGDLKSATTVPADGSIPKAGLGRILPPPVDEEDLLEDGTPKPAGLLVLNVSGQDHFLARYQDTLRPAGDTKELAAKAALFTSAELRLTDEEYQEDAEIAYVGKKLFVQLEDPDLDLSEERDTALVRIVSRTGEDEMIKLEETLSHSGVFSASLPLKAVPKPTPGNSQGEIECFFGDELTVGYLDNVPQTSDGETIIQLPLPVAVGTNGEMMAFSKVYKDEDLAIQTQFHIAESYFELFKSHLRLERAEEAQTDLEAGQRILRELREDYPNPKYAPRVAYLLGQFAQEMKSWDEAIDAYLSIVRGHPEHELAPDSQYKLGQCYEEAGQLDEALESYVTLAATYPKSPLIANVMLRINEHFYKKEEFTVAASVGGKFLERFPNHEWTPKMAFRIGQCFYKEEEFKKAGLAFDGFVKRFPDQELTAQALFWAGESYRMAKDIPYAFRRYNRCRWDFPETDAAKYSRGRLALPELLAQFEKEADLD